MKPLAPDSTRRIAASRFGAELRKAMAARNVGAKRLSAAIGTGTSAVAVYLSGSNLPRTDTAQRLAQALEWPKLATLARAGRTGICVRCGRSYVNEGGAPKRYCRDTCRDLAAQERGANAKQTLAAAVRAELDRVRGTTSAVSRNVLRDALAEYGRSESKRTSRGRTLEAELALGRAAVGAFCGSCEPAGVCRTPECELRPVSPLPLALRPAKTSDEIEPADGAWGPLHRPAMLETMRIANAERWSREGERERQAERSRARHAAMTPGDRATIIAKAKAAYPPERRSETSRRVHAARRTA